MLNLILPFQFRSLNQTEINKRVKAIRAGEKIEILAFDIMVGDILLLEKGDLIPADGIVLESFALLVDESSMTGESDMIEKSTVCTLNNSLPTISTHSALICL